MSTPASSTSWLPPVRPEYERVVELPKDVVADAPLPLARRLMAQSWLRKTLIALLLLATWEVAATRAQQRSVAARALGQR